MSVFLATIGLLTRNRDIYLDLESCEDGSVEVSNFKIEKSFLSPT